MKDLDGVGFIVFLIITLAYPNLLTIFIIYIVYRYLKEKKQNKINKY